MSNPEVGDVYEWVAPMAHVGGWIDAPMLVTDVYVRGDILLKGFPTVSPTLFAPVQIWIVVEDVK